MYQILFHLEFYSVYFFFHIWFITLKYTQVFVHYMHVKFNYMNYKILEFFNLHSNNVIMLGYLPWLDIFWTSCTWSDTDCGRAWHTERLSFQSGTPTNKIMEIIHNKQSQNQGASDHCKTLKFTSISNPSVPSTYAIQLFAVATTLYL